jgi:hypothetical protein
MPSATVLGASVTVEAAVELALAEVAVLALAAYCRSLEFNPSAQDRGWRLIWPERLFVDRLERLLDRRWRNPKQTGIGLG